MISYFRTARGRKVGLTVMFAAQTLLLGYATAKWWAVRNNTLFSNGQWISGKDTGKYVFYSYKFLFRPLVNSRVNLTTDMGYQEILHREPEGPDRRLAALNAEVHVAGGAYIWIELHKSALRMLACRLSRHGRYPPGLYRFDERGEVVQYLMFDEETPELDDKWTQVALAREDGLWRLSINGAPAGAIAVPEGWEGHVGFRGSGNPRAPALVKNIRLTFEDPARPGRRWTEVEKFNVRHRVRRVIGTALLFAVAVLLLRYGRSRVLLGWIRERRRRDFERAETSGLAVLLLVLALGPARPSGLHIAVFVLVAELMTIILLCCMKRKTGPLRYNGPARVTYGYGILLAALSAAAFFIMGESLGRIRAAAPDAVAGVHPDAFIREPDRNHSLKPFEIEEPLVVRPGRAFFVEDRAYRQERIGLDFVMPASSTLDIVFQQQSYRTRGDPQGETLAIQRRLLRLTTRDDVPWGISTRLGKRPAPFMAVEGSVKAGETNRVTILSDEAGLSIVLNGEETAFPHYKPLGFGLTGFMAYDKPVVLQRVTVEAASFAAAREGPAVWTGPLLPVALAGIIWLFFRFGDRIRFDAASAIAGITFYPIAFYFIGALFIGRQSFEFMGRDRMAWLDMLLIAGTCTFLAMIAVTRKRTRQDVILFNIGALALVVFMAMLVWDLLPEEHSLRLKFTDNAVAPAELRKGNRGGKGPWYSNNRLIGANTYIWKQTFGGERVTMPKPEGVVRVFVVGGSQAWGSGAASSDDTFAEILEKRLREKDLPVEIFNAGVNGAGAAKAFGYYSRLLRQFEPDVIIADVGLNDSAGLQRVRDADKLSKHVGGIMAAFREFLGWCEQDGVDVVLSLEAMSHEAGPRPCAELYEALAHTAREYGASVVDPIDTIGEKEKTHLVWWDTAHFAPYGHRLLASLLEPAVEQAVRARFKESR
ncbi:MAG: SGNH/GDSL hydrolase family protein [Kiritimatiellia bacterium]